MKKFTNARIYRQHDEASEILVEKGVIKQIGKKLPKADEEIDLRGCLVVPPYVDPHLHLDYVYTGSGTRTAASHTCSFGSADNAYAFRMMGLFQQSGLNFISLPTENAYLQGRQDTYPKRRGLTRIKEFWESGINVCFGQDSINDPWYPVGNGNLMNILDNGIHLAQTMSFDELDRCLDLITYNGAKTLNVEDQYGIEEGKPANFLVLDADSPFEAVRQRADVLSSIRNGEYLFKRPEPSYEIELDLFRKTN